MNTVKSGLILVLTMFTFIGSIGFGVYSHFCSEDGLEQSYFVRQAHHCDEKENDVPICCKHENSKEELTNDCCYDQVQLVQISMEYFQQISSFAFPLFSLPTPLFEVLDGTQKLKLIVECNLANPPPKLCGREIIIKNQVFLL